MNNPEEALFSPDRICDKCRYKMVINKPDHLICLARYYMTGEHRGKEVHKNNTCELFEEEFKKD